VSRGGRPAIVVAATPTSNGDLHIGHMAGPYLAGDIFSRYLAAAGRDVIYITCTDDSQSYVLTTARRQGVAPGRLCAESTSAIQRSMRAMGLSIVGLPPVRERYRATVTEYFTALHAAGRLRRRTVRVPYAARSGYLYDGLLTGVCPACLSQCSGGVCEGCGHPNHFDELLNPRSALDPDDPVSHRECSILVLPMEDYRDRLTAYFDDVGGNWRPRGRQLIQDLLARPLPEVPVSFPGTWGTPAPFAETPGQILYPWVEAMPAVIYSTWWAAAQRDGARRAAQVDEYWRAGRDAELVYFHGFDNVYHWGLVDLVMLMAHGDRYVLPAANVCNEFYNLEGQKFSTSRRHLIWCADLLADTPRDLVRFYLSLTAPETEQSNFSVAQLRSVTSHRLVQPWNHLGEVLATALAGAGTGLLPTSAAGRDRAIALTEKFRRCYELPAFSPARAAEHALTHVGRLTGVAASVADQHRGGAAREGGSGAGTGQGDLLLSVRALLSAMAPIMIDTAAEAAAGGVDVGMTVSPPPAVAPFRLPRLPDPHGGGSRPQKRADLTALSATPS